MSPLGTHLGILAQSAAGGGNLINTNSIEINGSTFTNTGIRGNGGGGNPTTFTYSCWFKMPSAVSTTVGLFNINLDPGGGFFSVAFQNPYLLMENRTAEGGPPATIYRDQVYTPSAGGFRDDAWHHLAIHCDNYTTDAGDFAIIVDGTDITQGLRDNNKPTAWSYNGTDTLYLGGTVTGARIAQLAYFDSIVAASTLYNGGTPGDLSTLSNPPIEWYQFVNNLNNDGSSGTNGTLSAGTPSFSTDHP